MQIRNNVDCPKEERKHTNKLRCISRENHSLNVCETDFVLCIISVHVVDVVFVPLLLATSKLDPKSETLILRIRLNIPLIYSSRLGY